MGTGATSVKCEIGEPLCQRTQRASVDVYDAAKNRRCLILLTGYFDWRHVYRNHKKTGKKLKTPDKYSYYVSLPKHEYFFMAGIWNPWTDKDTGEMVNTVALVTAVANPLMMQVHNSKERMPAILNEDLAWRWINDELSDEEILEIAATQHPHEEMSACTVASDFLASLDPSEVFEYEILPAIDLSLESKTGDAAEEQMSLF